MELILKKEYLPTTTDELHKYIQVGKEQLKARAAQISALDKIDAADNTKKAVLENAQNEADTLLDAEGKLGELLAAIEPEYVQVSSVTGTNLKPVAKKKTLPAGITKKESHQAQVVWRNPDIKEKVKKRARKSGKLGTAAEVIKGANKENKESERAVLAASAETVKPSNRWKIYHADIYKWKAPRQYDFIITDPPYPKEFLPLYETLATKSQEWLKPGGLLVAMCGQSYLNQIYQMMSKHIAYYWTAAYLTPGQPTPLRQVNVNTTWKPLLIFCNGKYEGKIFGDVFKSDKNDKSFHEWGQSESGMLSIISMMCLPGQYILDPFCGAGTTGVAALRHGCLFDGLEINEENKKIAVKRLNDAKKE